MYGIVEIQGHQYTVRAGDMVDVEKLNIAEGENFDLEKVLLLANDGEAVAIGAPFIQGATIKAKLIRHSKDKKILTIKRQPRKWLKRKGHRQNFSSILVTEIQDGKGNAVTISKESKAAQKYL